MVRVIILYPITAESRFDHQYYLEVHLPLALAKLAPYGLLRAESNGVVPYSFSRGEVQPPQYHAVGVLHFKTAEGFSEGMAAVGKEILDDVPNYANVRAKIVVTELLGSVDADPQQVGQTGRTMLGT